MSDINSLIQEIDEDLQHKKFMEAWKKYGNLIVLLALGIVLATAGLTGWNNWRVKSEQKATATLIQVVNDKDADAAKKIAELDSFAQKNGTTPQAVLARFETAYETLKSGKTDEAVGLYDSIAKDEKIEPAFRQLADLYAVQAQFDKGEPTVLMARLQTLFAGAWHLTAKEYAAHLALKMGDKEKAKKLFEELAQDQGISPIMLQRVQDMLRWINGSK